MQIKHQSSSIVILSGVQGDTRRYRTLHPYQQIRMAGFPCTLSHLTDSHLPGLISNAQVVIFHRVAYDRYVEGLVQSIHSRQGLVILDIDDLIFDVNAFHWIDSPDFKDPIRANLYQEEMNRHKQMLEHSDAILASTDYLAGLARKFSKPVWVHRNAFSLEMHAISEKARLIQRLPGNKIVIGYASGTLTHNKDFAMITPVLQAVMKRNSQIHLKIAGRLTLGKEWAQFKSRISKVPLVNWRELPAVLAGFDINLAPLLMDNPFNKSKSAIKFMEAALVGVPTIASATEAFQSAIDPGRNGFTAASEADWIMAIERLLDPLERKQIGEAAFKEVLEKDSAMNRSSEWPAKLQEICLISGKPAVWENFERFSDQVEKSSNWTPESWRLDPEIEEHPNRLEQGIYSLRHRDVGTLARQVWVFFRRLVNG